MMACVWTFHEPRVNRLPAPAIKFLGAFLLACAPQLAPLNAGEPGSAVVVIYNSKMAESKQVADYYVQQRQVPSNQVFGFDLPITESMTRPEFLGKLQGPLLKELEAAKLFTFTPGTK